MYREVSVIEVREVLRAWLAGSGFRTAGAQAGVDRKTARRYVAAYAGESGAAFDEADSAAPLILTGHQPGLVHPGVWLKNFAAAAWMNYSPPPINLPRLISLP